MKKHMAWALALVVLGVNVTPTWANEVTTQQVLDVTTEDLNTTTDLNTTEDFNTTGDSETTTEDLNTTEDPDTTPEQESEESEEETQEPQVDLSQSIMLTLGSNVAMLYGEPYPLDVPPSAKEGNTYVELRFVVEQLLDAETSWDQETRQTTIKKDAKSVILTPGSNVAIINGASIPMPGPMLIENGRTLVPLRFLSEEFGVKVDYNATDKTITLTATDEIPVTNTIPVADFEFSEPNYVAGQSVEVIDKSFDEDGDAIVAKTWMINGDTANTSTSLGSIFKKPKAGMHQISLKVKDAKGVWSDWTTKVIEILPNEKPVVTEIKTHKKEYAQGEEIELDYTYENEAWESITNERWSYCLAGEPDKKKVAGKPTALFVEGNYVVTLELTDAYGNVSAVKEQLVKVTNKQLMSEFEYKFTNGEVGEIIDNFNKHNYRDFPEEQNVLLLRNNKTLVMSNSPERVSELGILYEETIQDEGRIMIHHINALGEAANAQERKKIVVTAENTTEEPVTLTIYNQVVKVPSTDQLYLGQQLLIDYFRGAPAKTYTIQPGQMIAIYDSTGKRWSTEEGISGLMDFYATGELKVRVAAMNQSTPMEQVVNMSYSPQDVHPRGTFPMTERYYKVDLESSKPTALILGKDAEEWAEGIDGITGEVVKNRGNYGITYRVSITAKEDTGVILNPRGGLFRGAIKWEDGVITLMPQHGFLGEYERAAIIGVVKAGETRTFQYMLPNGSAAPVLVGFIPKSAWDNY